MPTLEERVAYLEGRVRDHATAGHDLRASVTELREEMMRRFEQVDRRFDQIDRRFEQIDRRLEHVDLRFDQIGRQFMWLVGILLTGFIAVIGTVGSAFWGVLQLVRQ
jgi:hypothetical protein